MGGCFGRGCEDTRGHGLTRGSQRAVSTQTCPNKLLSKRCPKWKSDNPMTESQLRSKRDEFWHTAPMYGGHGEIWDALRATAGAMECEDHKLAQAVVEGAGITLPCGTLTKCYDQLGYCYQVPIYCLGPPTNLISESSDEDPSDSPELPVASEKEFQLKVRLSTGKDVDLGANMVDTISQLKNQLQAQEAIDVARQRWFFFGKLLTDNTQLRDTKIEKDFVIQVIVNPLAPPASKPSPTSSTTNTSTTSQ